MKKLVFLIIMLNVLAGNAQYSVSALYNDISNYISLIEGKYQGQIIRIEFDITTGQSQTFRYLAKGNVYSFMVIGDTTKIKNVDIAIYQNISGEWKKIAEDTQTEKMAFLNYEPDTGDFYKIEITADFINENKFGYYSLIIFR